MAPRLTQQPRSIVADFHRLLDEDADLTMPIAAIQALIRQLSRESSTTAMETVDIIRTQAALLQTGVANPIPVKAGADILMAFLDQKLRQSVEPTSTRQAPAGGITESFDQAIGRLFASGRLYVQRAREARAKMAELGSREVRDGSVILTAGGSRAVRDVLLRAADRDRQHWGSPRFRVVYVTDDHFRAESDAVVAALRQRGILVAEVDGRSVAHVIETADVSKVFVGTEVVTHDGNLISRIGTYQLAKLAHAANKDFVAFAETHKFVLFNTVGNTALVHRGINQAVLDFRSAEQRVEPAVKPGHPLLPTKSQVDFTVCPSPAGLGRKFRAAPSLHLR